MTDFNTGPYYYERIRNLNTIISLNTNEETANESYVVLFERQLTRLPPPARCAHSFICI